MKEYNIRHHKSSPYHPEENGQYKVTNREIEAILTKTVHIHKQDWNNRLIEDFWAYHTTWKKTNKFTPFKLVYGKATMFPIEFEHKTLCTTLELNISLPATQQERLLHLNLLDEIQKRALEKTKIIKQ